MPPVTHFTRQPIVFKPFDNRRILVVGDLMLDRYWNGDTARISPEAPVPVVRVKDIEERPGGAGNVAMNIATLGAHATVVGIVGHDEAGQRLDALLSGEGCATHFVWAQNSSTITKLRVISRQQQLLRLDFESSLPDGLGGQLEQSFKECLTAAELVVLSDYAKGSLQHPEGFIKAARSLGIPVVVDPKRADFSAYRGASVVTPNMHEFQIAVGMCQSDDDIASRGLQLMRSTGIDGMLVTRSEQGMTLLQHHQAPLHLPTNARQVFDVTGAGDTVVAVLATSLAAGESLARSAHLANLAAGIVVGKFGTATTTQQELKTALNVQTHSNRNVVDENTLLQKVREMRRLGARVVMTNGCFDILHPGHVAYLEDARRLGDVLIVAVNDDTSICRLKGPDRPINVLADRMAVLAGLRCVDWVVPFSEDTPEKLICTVKPDVLVKGGDYLPEQIAGHSCVMQSGGQVLVLPFITGCSTTKIIQNIRQTSN